ncbi:carbohydrate porin [Vibrio sp. 1-Bac 57]
MKKSFLTPSILALLFASTAHAGAVYETPIGTINLGVDAEFDFSNESNVNKIEQRTDNDAKIFNSGGRLKFLFDGQRTLENGHFVGFNLHPIWRQNGNDNNGNAHEITLQFGVVNDWSIKAGHFEATTLSYQGQDTYFVTANSTVYRAKQFRGRTGYPQITFTKTLNDNFGFELTAQSRDDGSTMVARPLVTYDTDTVSMAFGFEIPVATDSSDIAGKDVASFITANDNVKDDFNDSSKVVDDGNAWFGSAVTGIYKVTNDLALNARMGYLSDKRINDNEATSFSMGVGAQYQNFYIATLYGARNADKNANDTEELRIYTSYKFPSVLDLENFDIYLGAGYTQTKIGDNSKESAIGGRVRLKYHF